MLMLKQEQMRRSEMFNYRYIATKPVTFEDMDGHRWHYVEAPPERAAQMPGVPTSKHEHGVIATERMVLENQRARAGLETVKFTPA
jgi:hypothetical protein